MFILFLLDVLCKGVWFFMYIMRGNIENEMILFIVYNYIYIYFFDFV